MLGTIGSHGPRPVALVVDDNDGFIRVVRAMLEPEFEVHSAGTGGAALAFLARRAPLEAPARPAFVVLDFHLPDLDAPEVLREIRGRAEIATMPVLVLSQADWSEDEAAAVGAGADAFCVKPSSLDALRELVVGFWRVKKLSP